MRIHLTGYWLGLTLDFIVRVTYRRTEGGVLRSRLLKLYGASEFELLIDSQQPFSDNLRTVLSYIQSNKNKGGHLTLLSVGLAANAERTEIAVCHTAWQHV